MEGGWRDLKSQNLADGTFSDPDNFDKAINAGVEDMNKE